MQTFPFLLLAWSLCKRLYPSIGNFSTDESIDEPKNVSDRSIIS